MNGYERILVVEDDPKLARLLTRALDDAGVAADTAASGEEAIVLVTTTVYSALVVDVMLPGMDGLEVCRRLRRGGLRCPVLVISARDLDTALVAAAGADAFVQKPFQLSGLTQRIHQLPARSPQRRCPGETVLGDAPRSAGVVPATPMRPGRWHIAASRSLRGTLTRRRISDRESP